MTAASDGDTRQVANAGIVAILRALLLALRADSLGIAPLPLLPFDHSP
jgi:hypothetical protein